MKLMVYEVCNMQSMRYGRCISAKTMKDAKCNATRNQAYNDTILKIEDLDGKLLSYKDKNGIWHNEEVIK